MKPIFSMPSALGTFLCLGLVAHIQSVRAEHPLDKEIKNNSTHNVSASESNNSVGFKLMKELRKLNGDEKNYLVSPLSAHMALSMALNGADGQTKTDFLTALNYSENQNVEVINQQNKTMLQNLVKNPPTEAELANWPQWKPQPTVLSIQNMVWSTNGKTTGRPFNFQESYLQKLKQIYNVEAPQSLDFKNPESANVINNWTKKATFGLIPEIIDADTLSELVWLLENTVYLEGQWDQPFYKIEEPALELSFLTPSGDRKKVTTIRRSKAGLISQQNLADVTAVNFANGSIVAYIVLPKSLADYQTLNGENGVWSSYFWNQVFTSWQETTVNITMPTFTIGDELVMLKDASLTRQMGLNPLFQNDAQFTKMDSLDPNAIKSKIGIIKQNTKLEWTEKGVKAAAATIVGGAERTAMPPRTTFEFNVDRPFYVAIYDQTTKTFLFLGSVVDPQAH